MKILRLVESYSSGSVWREQHDQWDLRYRLLSLILLLADSPVNHPYSPTPPELEEEEAVDWRALLREGEEEPPTWEGEEDSLSDWSEEEGEQVAEQEEQVEQELKRLTVNKEREAKPERLKEGEDVGEEWREGLQRRWWLGEQEALPTSSHPAARFASRVEGEEERAGRVGGRSTRVTEYQAVREVLWQLRCPTPSPLLLLEGSTWRPSSLFSLSSLTSPALGALLGEVTPALAEVSLLNTFLTATEVEGEVPHTLEGYASGLRLYLDSFSQVLFEVEEEVRGQESTCTLLGVVARLRPHLSTLHHLAALHRRATSGWQTADNWYKSVRLLSVLYNCLTSSSSAEVVARVLDLFLRAVRPYLAITHAWLAEGRLEDFRGEFIFHRAEGQQAEVNMAY